jgi:phage terminase large subunit
MQRAGNYWHMMPQQNQCRRAIWEAVNPDTGKRRIDEAFPDEIVADRLQNEMQIRFINGSTWSCIGSDAWNNLIGASPAGLVFSEFSTSDPNSWIYLEPIVNANQGWALFISTPRGENHLARLYEEHRDDPNWFCEVLSAYDTEVFTQEQLDEARKSYVALHGEDVGDAYFRQEYLASWSAALVGAYYGREMEALDEKGQIANVPYDSKYPVHTAWDIGSRDATSIILFQVIGKEIRIIDYIENSGVGADWYKRELDQKKVTLKNDLVTKLEAANASQDTITDLLSRPYVWGQHVMPSDVNNEEWGVGRTRLQTLRSLGIIPRVLPPQKSIHDGINAVRQILPSCWIDRTNCKRLITALKQYHRTWDDIRKCYNDKPYHDWASNPADAMRYLAVADVRNSVKREIKYSNKGIV